MKVRRIIDVSRQISPAMPVWPGDDGIEIHRLASIEGGDSCNLSSIAMGLHAGTHVDAPLHFIDNAASIEALDLFRFIGYAKVFELDVSGVITGDSIKGLEINEGDIVLFKTANSLIPAKGEFQKEFIYLDSSAAQVLVDRKVGAVGVDYLSIDRFHSSGHPAHHILLSGEIGVIEGLYLKEVEAGTYFFSCLPLKIEGVEGTPARAVLLELE